MDNLARYRTVINRSTRPPSEIGWRTKFSTAQIRFLARLSSIRVTNAHDSTGRLRVAVFSVARPRRQRSSDLRFIHSSGRTDRECVR